MDQDQKELTLDESLAEVMQTLPPVIRTYLTQGKYTVVAKNLMSKYRLRIDQGGVLEREIMLLLMGVETPDEFTKALAEDARLDQPTVDGIVQDINNQIFIPLRKEEEGGIMAPQQPMQVPLPPKPASYFNLENKIPPHIAPLPPKFISPKSEMPIVPASLGPTPQNLPGAMPPVSIPEVQPIEQDTLLTQPASQLDLPEAKPVQREVPIIPPAIRQVQSQPGIPVLSKPYSSDPYREPVDEA